jgi:peptidoglycan/xylan/chitin deacetylase (PgdA/CDA1 family)
MSWLDPVRRALDEATGPCPLFVRDDDAGWADDRLASLLDVLDRHGLPVDVAVIPAAVTPCSARALAARAADGRVRLHQHGLVHLDHEPVGRKCEFGTARDAATQHADIGAGRRILLDAFGDLLDPVFTPPWNRCTAATGDALVAHGLRVLSRDRTAPALDRADLVEVPVSVDWFAHRKGERLPRSGVAEQVAAAVRSGAPVGLMLHHAVTDDAERAGVAELLAVLGAHPNTRATTIVELAGCA